MMALAESAASAAGCARRSGWSQWIKANLLSGTAWNERRLIIFTEWEDTRRWLERRLREALADTDRADERIGVFTGATGAGSPRGGEGGLQRRSRRRSRCAS